MKRSITSNLDIKFISEEEISEIIFKKLLDEETFCFVFLNTNVLFRLIFDEEFRKSFPQNTIFVPSSKFVGFIISNLIDHKSHSTIRESSCIFKVLKTISDYHYRVLVVEKSDSIVSKFKKNFRSSLRDSSLNIIGIYNIFGRRVKDKKIETMRKIEPDITIVGRNIPKVVKLLAKDKKLLKDSSFVFSSDGIRVIAGVGGFELFLEKIKMFFESIIIVLWFLFKKIGKVLKGGK